MGFKNINMKIKNIKILLLRFSYIKVTIISLPILILFPKFIDLLQYLKDHYICTVIYLVVIITKLRLTKKGSASQSPSKQSSIGASPLLGDAPITEASEDILNRGRFVESLKSIISAYPLNEESVRICIDAKWGDGKTSIFNLLKEKLKEKKDIVCIDFNPWYYNNEESALKGLIELLGGTVSNQHPYPSTNSDIDKLIKVIVGGVCNRFLGISFGTLF